MTLVTFNPDRLAYLSRFLSTDMNRPALTGVAFRNNQMAATDGHRLAWEPCQAPVDVVLPPEAVKHLLARKLGSFDTSGPWALCGSARFPLIPSPYPDWFRALPATGFGPWVDVDLSRVTEKFVAVAYDGSIAWQSNDPRRCEGCCAFQTHLLRSMEPTRLAFSLGNWKRQPVMTGPTAAVMPYNMGDEA